MTRANEPDADPLPPIGATGTLAELRVQPGDVVEWHGRKYTAFHGDEPIYSLDYWARYSGLSWLGNDSVCRLISRASSGFPSPVRVVTKREIVSGQYGALEVLRPGLYRIQTDSAEDLTAAIDVLAEIRNALLGDD